MLVPFRRWVLVLCGLGLLVWTLDGQAPGARTAPATFAAQIARLSEPPGFFDTDNLVSNERSYLDAIPTLVERGVRGGAYIGVGPDQNFSYIARIRPSVAYIIDVRRDNLLLHLLFKALFTNVATRIEYISLLTGRAPPPDPASWSEAGLDRIVAYIEQSEPAGDLDARLAHLDRTIAGFGVPVSAADLQTIRRFHHAFVSEGLALRFRSHGRAPQPYYPTLRELLLATDKRGTRWNYLASESDFQFLRSLQLADDVVPVIGDVAGAYALKAIAQVLAGTDERVSAFYISNVEFYLSGARYAKFVDNLKRLPREPGSVMIRSVFGGGPSRTMVQLLDDMIR